MNISLKHYWSGDTSSLVLWCSQCDIPWYPLQNYKSWTNQSCHPISSMRLDWLLCFWIFSSCGNVDFMGARLFDKRSYCKMQSRRYSQIERKLQYYLDDISVKNEPGTVRPQDCKAKTTVFRLKCVYLPASTCTRTPHIYTSLHHLCLTKRLLAYHLHLFPMKFPKNEAKKSVPNFCCNSEIWNPLHETSKKDRRNLFGRFD